VRLAVSGIDQIELNVKLLVHRIGVFKGGAGRALAPRQTVPPIKSCQDKKKSRAVCCVYPAAMDFD